MNEKMLEIWLKNIHKENLIIIGQIDCSEATDTDDRQT